MALFDLLICNASVLDGSGSPTFSADLAIQEGRIMAIGSLEGAQAQTILDASGCIVCPGFIDTHSHSDLTLFDDASAWNKVEQGITTEITGMCGMSLAPVSEACATVVREIMPFLLPSTSNQLDRFHTFGGLFQAYQELKPATNLAIFAGHNILRGVTVGLKDAPPTPFHLKQMQSLLSDAMQEGTLGVSFGLIYPPGAYSHPEELVEIARTAAQNSGGLTVHLRSEGNRLVESVQEMLEVARRSGAYIIFSHHKAAGRPNWGKVHQTLELIEQARREGIRAWLDVYPYTASSTSLKTMIPAEFHDGGVQTVLALLASSSGRDRIRRRMLHPEGNDETQFLNAGFEGTLIVDSPACPETKGKTVAQIAGESAQDPFDVLFDILHADQLGSMAAYFMMQEDDVRAVMQHPLTMMGTDEATFPRGYGCVPRAVGTFPRILGRYVREQKVLTLPEAIHKATGLPAQAYGLVSKGFIKPGWDADLVIFDPETVLDQADFSKPDAPNEGIRVVLVHGEMAVFNGVSTGIRAGRILRAKNGVVL